MAPLFSRLFSGHDQRVTVEEAYRRTHADHAPALLLDVREQGEWDAGHAPGAVLAPLSGLVAGASLPPGAHGRPLVVICRSGNRSRQAADLLRARGADVVDVKGGMQEWASAGHPVVDGHGHGNGGRGNDGHGNDGTVG